MRHWLYRTHILIGLIAGGWIAWMALTGMGLALGPILLAGAKTPPIVKPHSGVPFKAWRPTGGTSLTLFSTPSSAVLLGHGATQRGSWINPYTGDLIRAESDWPRWMRRLETWHRWVGLHGTPQRVVRMVKAAACVGLVGLVITGVWHGRGRRVTSNTPWHNKLGVWASPILVLMALTGVAISTEPIKKPMTGSRDFPSTFPIQLVMEEIQQQYPEWDRVVIKWGRSVTTVVECNTWTRYQMEWDDAGKWHKTTPRTNWPKLLHTGQVGGILGSLLALLGAMAALLLVGSGTQLVIQRWRNRI